MRPNTRSGSTAIRSGGYTRRTGVDGVRLSTRTGISRPRLPGWWQLCLCTALIGAGCQPTETASFTPAQPTVVSAAPSATQVPASSLSKWREFRATYGLPADDPWMLQVAADPASAPGEKKYGVPLTPAEVADLDSRTLAVEAIKRQVVDYGAAHPADYAGAFVDQQHGGTLVVQFTANLGLHRAALWAHIRPGANVAVRMATWSLAHLQGQVARLDHDDAWFAQIPAVLTSYGVDTAANRLFLRISSAAVDAAARIAEHYGWPADLAIVESDGTGALLLPTGIAVMTVRTGAGVPVSGVQCVPIPDLPGAYEVPETRLTTDRNGVCRAVLPATGYWLRIESGEGPPTVIGVTRMVVSAGSTVQVSVTAR